MKKQKPETTKIIIDLSEKYLIELLRKLERVQDKYSEDDYRYNPKADNRIILEFEERINLEEYEFSEIDILGEEAYLHFQFTDTINLLGE